MTIAGPIQLTGHGPVIRIDGAAKPFAAQKTYSLRFALQGGVLSPEFNPPVPRTLVYRRSELKDAISSSTIKVRPTSPATASADDWHLTNIHPSTTVNNFSS